MSSSLLPLNITPLITSIHPPVDGNGMSEIMTSSGVPARSFAFGPLTPAGAATAGGRVIHFHERPPALDRYPGEFRDDCVGHGRRNLHGGMALAHLHASQLVLGN